MDLNSKKAEMHLEVQAKDFAKVEDIVARRVEEFLRRGENFEITPKQAQMLVRGALISLLQGIRAK